MGWALINSGNHAAFKSQACKYRNANMFHKICKDQNKPGCCRDWPHECSPNRWKYKIIHPRLIMIISYQLLLPYLFAQYFIVLVPSFWNFTLVPNRPQCLWEHFSLRHVLHLSPLSARPCSKQTSAKWNEYKKIYGYKVGHHCVASQQPLGTWLGSKTSE